MTSISSAHLKLSVVDVFRAVVASDGDAYICRFYNTSENQPQLFKNCRLSGVVMDHCGESSFALDDATGVIAVIVKTGTRLPEVGEYVEVLGRITGQAERVIQSLSVRARTDVMEEVRHMLEQAAIHRDTQGFKKAAAEVFLSSEGVTMTTFDRYAELVAEMLEKCDQGVGISVEEVCTACGNNRDIAEKVVDGLQTTGIGYIKDGSLFKL